MYNEEHVIQGAYLAQEFDEPLIREIADYLRPDNILYVKTINSSHIASVYVVANEYEGKTDQLEKWYKTEYAEQRLSDDFIEVCSV
jgi:hypothetical protein